jgi:hypothetical protein
MAEIPMDDDMKQARALYEDLGAVPVINAMGHMTMLGGSSPSPGVRAAMEQADRYYVDMDQLLTGSGRVVADLLGCEAALVTPGCVAALREWLDPARPDDRDEAASRRGRALRQLLTDIPGIDWRPAEGDRVTGPHVRTSDGRLDGAALAERLRAQDPSVWVHHDDEGVAFGLHTVHDGDEPAIAEALRRALAT